MASAPTPYVRPPRRLSFAGPIILITLGIVFLLGNMGLLSWHGIGLWFAHFWPLLLILWGGIKLVEYYLAQRAGERAAGLGAGGVVLIILLIASGLVASIVARIGRNVWENVGGNVEMGDEDFASIWGNTYQASDSLEQPFIAGNASVTMSHGDFAVHKLTGDLSLSGRASDAEIQDVSGTVSLDGDFFNDVSLTNVGKLVRFNSSRTNLQIGSLPGEMKMDPGDLRVENAAGGFNIRTRSKDIRLENIGGDVDIEDKNAEVELHAGRLPMGSVAISNQRGPIQVYLPPQMPFELEASARNGEIQSDFSEVHVQNQGSQAMANGSVGAGGKRVQLTTEHADIEIRRGLVPPEAPAAPAPPAGLGKPPKAPKPPKKLPSPGGGGKPIVSTNLI